MKKKKITLRLTWSEIMVLHGMAGHYLNDENSPILTWGWDPSLDEDDHAPIGIKTLRSLYRTIEDELGPRIMKKKIATGRDQWRDKNAKYKTSLRYASKQRA